MDIDLYKKIIDYQGHNKLLMGMSLGCDAVAMLIDCADSGLFDIENSVYFYLSYGDLIPPWHVEYIKYIENKFKIKITILPSPNYTAIMSIRQFQDPINSLIMESHRGTEYHYDYIPMVDMQKYILWASNMPDNTLVALGLKSGDSMFRRKYMEKCKGIDTNKKAWYPIWDYEKGDLVKPFERNKIYVNYDYELFGQSFELVGWSVFDLVIYDKCPEFRKKIEELFPQFEMSVKRFRYYYPERYIKKDSLKKLQFKKRNLIYPYQGEL